uniref:Uncharacterized protein n=1 Tax=Ditylum brightwellii TaxID=49249 RepID=A0A7S4RC18_9STRA
MYYRQSTTTDAKRQNVDMTPGLSPKRKEGLKKASEILDKVIINRIRRKGKDVVLLVVEFLLALVGIILAITREKDGAPKITTIIFCAAIAFYVICLALMLTWNVFHLPPNVSTSEEVEEAYKKTNSNYMIDGILEIPIAIKFGLKWPVFIVWGIFLVGFGFLLYILQTNTAIERDVYVNSLLAALLLYRVTSDTCEFWVHTLPEHRKHYATDDNKLEGDVEDLDATFEIDENPAEF